MQRPKHSFTWLMLHTKQTTSADEPWFLDTNRTRTIQPGTAWSAVFQHSVCWCPCSGSSGLDLFLFCAHFIMGIHFHCYTHTYSHMSKTLWPNCIFLPKYVLPSTLVTGNYYRSVHVLEFHVFTLELHPVSFVQEVTNRSPVIISAFPPLLILCSSPD